MPRFNRKGWMKRAKKKAERWQEKGHREALSRQRYKRLLDVAERTIGNGAGRHDNFIKGELL